MFQIEFKTFASLPFSVEFTPGRITFLMGANGTGKSTLMDAISRQNSRNVSRIYAHRNVTLDSSSVSLTGNVREQFDSTLRHIFSDISYRYKNDYNSQTVNTQLYDIHAAETKFSIDQLRKINSADPRTDAGLAVWDSSRKSLSPFQRVERILNAAGLRFSLEVDERGTIKVIRAGHKPYGIQELSDGERSAFLLAATIIAAPANRLVLIDEPERHLHRSISSPLIHALLSERPDCAFVISTHDVGLPLDQPECSALLLRGYKHEPQSWRADYFRQIETIDDQIVEDILGARRTIIFVEGKRNSLDLALYSHLFPDVSVRAQNSCNDVINATRGVNDTMSDHWIRAIGLIDRDRRGESDVTRLAEHSVVALKVHSIESIYYHPAVVRRVANRFHLAGSIRFDEVDRQLNAVILQEFVSARDKLISDAAARAVRNAVLSRLPKARDFGGTPAPSAGLSSVEVEEIFAEEKANFDKLIEANDIEGLCFAYAVKRTGVVRAVCDLLKLKEESAYTETVRKMAIDDEPAAELMRSFVEPLSQHVKSAQEQTEADGPE
jgi:ABC-type lipoprotein export system ATPase subunit